MIDELVVRNLGVIREARVELGPGLTVVTGETGAGKTLLLGALRMLLGADARSDLVGPFGDEAVVEGRLVVGGAEVGAGRRLRREGRSRAYLNGSIASTAALDEATTGAVEIIGQHDQLSITRPAEVRRLVDRRLDDDGNTVRDAYAVAWKERAALLADRQALGGDRPALERERATARHDVETIRAAALVDGEDEALDARLDRLRNAERIRSLGADAAEAVDRARDDVGAAVGLLRKLVALDATVASVLSSVDGVESELGEAATSLARLLEDLEVTPDDLESAENRRALLSDLARRYGPTVGDILAFGERQARRAEELDGLLDRADRIDDELSAAERRLAAAGKALREARQRAGGALVADALDHLRALGFTRPLLSVRVEESEPAPAGADVVVIEFASDDRLEPGPVSKVASGGELSRLVLSLRLAGDAGEAGAVVFDEIDTGVGGVTAIAVGEKLAALARSRQVLCVTHLPQVAAHADTHWVVDREGDEAVVRRVEDDARIDELTRMLAGIPESERGREAAEELLGRVSR